MVITCRVNDGGVPPTFSYHAIVSSKKDADSTSTSPSPSTSAAKTDSGNTLCRVTERALKIGEAPGKIPEACSNHNTASSSREEPITSTSSSPSRSAAKTLDALSRLSVTRCAVNVGVRVGSFASQSFSNQ